MFWVCKQVRGGVPALLCKSICARTLVCGCRGETAGDSEAGDQHPTAGGSVEDGGRAGHATEMSI